MNGPAHIRQLIEHGLLDALRIPADDAQLPRVGIATILIKLVLLDPFGRHEFIDEIHVVVDTPNFEDFLAAQAHAFVPTLLLAQVVGLLKFLAELAFVPSDLRYRGRAPDRFCTD